MTSPDRIEILSSLLKQFQSANAQLNKERTEARARHDTVRSEAETRKQQTLEKVETLRVAAYKAYGAAQETLAHARLAQASTPANFIAPEPVGQTDYLKTLEESTQQIKQKADEVARAVRELEEARLANRRWFRRFVVLGIAVIIIAAIAAYLLGPSLRDIYLKASIEVTPVFLVDAAPQWVQDPSWLIPDSSLGAIPLRETAAKTFTLPSPLRINELEICTL